MLYLAVAKVYFNQLGCLNGLQKSRFGLPISRFGLLHLQLLLVSLPSLTSIDFIYKNSVENIIVRILKSAKYCNINRN
jgi:hypothetical protein